MNGDSISMELYMLKSLTEMAGRLTDRIVTGRVEAKEVASGDNAEQFHLLTCAIDSLVEAAFGDPDSPLGENLVDKADDLEKAARMWVEANR